MRFCQPKAIYSTYKYLKRKQGQKVADEYLKSRMKACTK